MLLASVSNKGDGIASKAPGEAWERATRLLASGRPLEALNCVALDDEPRALALRGVALAQLGALGEAQALLRRARTSLESESSVMGARCVAAEAEIAIAARDLTAPMEPLVRAGAVLRDWGDDRNAAYAELVMARRSLLLGKLNDVDASLGKLAFLRVPPTLVAVAHLLASEVAIRRLRASVARRALAIAEGAARQSEIASLQHEVARCRSQLEGVAARALTSEGERSLSLGEVEALLEGPDFVVDACRRCVRARGEVISLVQRPTLFALLRELAADSEGGVAREVLIARGFGVKKPNDSHRARLRVDMGRLRRLLSGVAWVRATQRGYALRPCLAEEGAFSENGRVVLLLPPIDAPYAEIAALLADGCAWSTGALALATGTSQRTCQRALASLQAEGRVTSVGRGSARRWLSEPLTGVATAMLLPPAGVIV